MPTTVLHLQYNNKKSLNGQSQNMHQPRSQLVLQENVLQTEKHNREREGKRFQMRE